MIAQVLSIIKAHLPSHSTPAQPAQHLTGRPLADSPGADWLVEGGSRVVVGRGGMFAWADKSDLTQWTRLPDFSSQVPHPGFVIVFYMAYDPVNRVIYAAMSDNGFWRYALP